MLDNSNQLPTTLKLPLVIPLMTKEICKQAKWPIGSGRIFTHNIVNFLGSSVRKKDLVMSYFILHHMCKTLTDRIQLANSVTLAFCLQFK
jgi:hypothetical protein